MSTQKDKDMLTVEEIAQDLRVSEATIRRWIRDGKLPALDLIGQYRIRRADYEEFLRQRSRGHID
jgi:excisionase family DNA binding protein